MKKLTKYILIGTVALSLISCSKKKPALVYFPDMYYPVAYDPYEEAVLAYGEQTTTVPLFKKHDGRTALDPVPGSIAQNPEGILPMDLPATPEGYEASKNVVSPLNPENKEKDLARGKLLFDRTCAVCHGTAGDGQGNIVQSGAYSGVPNYKDRQITVGSVYYVMLHGRNAMGSYAGQLLPGDMWRVAEYVIHEFKPEVENSSKVATIKTTTETSEQ
ncbi:cytochrome c [Apibacter muscae]|uniref:c-type cytochrome n=1 Tax=Apibacter muscae TaxID=2509004 RepID=UPI0011AC8C46|nr:cytochrome c [Apibacter muscae]TWP31543.1 cytochrome c [Apibacter muscae]